MFLFKWTISGPSKGGATRADFGTGREKMSDRGRPDHDEDDQDDVVVRDDDGDDDDDGR